MRYEDWDVLLFPRDCKVPVKEFKVACHVVHDTEFSNTQSLFGVPTICCFVPSLAAGTPFQISIHSWSIPSISQFTRSYTKYLDNVKFEARLFIDGRLTASTSLKRSNEWPHVIDTSPEVSKHGDLSALRFPTFRQELLQQNYWSPADDLGRIRVIISEGFPRNSLSTPIERVKNVVAFSFQHAPLGILESSSIAWPNPSMWKRAPFTASIPATGHSSGDAESQAQSPHRRASGFLHSGPSGNPIPIIPEIVSNAVTNTGARRITHPWCSGAQPLPGNSGLDPFSDANAYFEWLGGIGMGMGDGSRVSHRSSSSRVARNARKSSTDISMPDYVTSNPDGQQPTATDGQYSLSSSLHDEDARVSYLKVPTNTPTTGGPGCYESEATAVPFPLLSHNVSIPFELATSLTNSLLNQPMPTSMQPRHGIHAPANEIKSRKENRRQQLANHSPSTTSSNSTPGQAHLEMRKVSQQMFIPSGSSLPMGTALSQADSPSSRARSDSSQRDSSMAGSCAESDSTAEANLLGALGHPIEKGTKRIRNYGSGLGKAAGDEDEPRLGSPRVRLTPFSEEGSHINSRS